MCETNKIEKGNKFWIGLGAGLGAGIFWNVILNLWGFGNGFLLILGSGIVVFSLLVGSFSFTQTNKGECK